MTLDRFRLPASLCLIATLTIFNAAAAPATPQPASGLYTRQAGVGPEPLWLRIAPAGRDGWTLELGSGSQVIAQDLVGSVGASLAGEEPVVDFRVGPRCKLSIEFSPKAAAVRQSGACARLGGNVGGFYLRGRDGA